MAYQKTNNHKPKSARIKRVRFSVGLPKETYKKAVRMAKIRDMSLSEFITYLVEN